MLAISTLSTAWIEAPARRRCRRASRGEATGDRKAQRSDQQFDESEEHEEAADHDRRARGKQLIARPFAKLLQQVARANQQQQIEGERDGEERGAIHARRDDGPRASA